MATEPDDAYSLIFRHTQVHNSQSDPLDLIPIDIDAQAFFPQHHRKPDTELDMQTHLILVKNESTVNVFRWL